MKHNTAPEIYVYERSRKKSYGVVKNLLEFSEDVRFNACSEVSFKVPQKVYDTQTEQWVYNQIYDYLEEDKLLYLTDEHEYFRHPVRKPGDKNFYMKYESPSMSRYRDTNSNLSFNPYYTYKNFAVAPETELFDIGSQQGYHFRQFCGISSADINKGQFLDYSSRLNQWVTLNPSGTASEQASYGSRFIACQELIPVSSYDIIAIRNTYTKEIGLNWGDEFLAEIDTAAYDAFSWDIFFYADEGGTQCLGSFESSDYTDNINIIRIAVKDYLDGRESGYIRICNDSEKSSQYNDDYVSANTHYFLGASTGFAVSGNVQSYRWESKYLCPDYGFIKIYSGERFCRYIGLKNVNGYEYPKMHWFVITSTEEEDDGICAVKTVTAYSYEYTLQNATVTIAENTLPLYVPPSISNVINHDSWVIDRYQSGSNDIQITSAQKLNNGLLNYVLSCLPGWKLGNISQDLMTTYRQVQPVDEVSIYSFLTQTVQELYHCFIVFNNDEKTISAYTMKDLLSTWENEGTQGNTRSIKLTWDNSIKSLKKDNKDTHTYTALHVNTADNQYGVGLLNPTGTNVIYNFTPILSEMEYSDPALYQAVKAWQTAYNKDLLKILDEYKRYRDLGSSDVGGTPVLSFPTGEYISYSYAKSFVQYNEECVKAESKIATALADYRAVVSKINTLLKNNSYDATSLLPDSPLTVTQIRDRSVKDCYSGTMKQELYNASANYYEAKYAYSHAFGLKNSSFATLSFNSKNFSVNPLSTIPQSPLLTKAQREKLADYIKEGNWKDENATFSDNYGAEDICSTILDVLSKAWDDLTTRLSIINYDFTVDIANVAAIPEFEQFVDQMYLGLPVYLDVGERQLLTPILLERHINYFDDDDFAFTFTTDMKRRPLKFRFADLYSTIQQTNVYDTTFTFDT